MSQYKFIKTFYIIETISIILVLSFCLTLILVSKPGHAFLVFILFLLLVFHFAYTTAFYTKLLKLSKTVLN